MLFKALCHPAGHALLRPGGCVTKTWKVMRLTTFLLLAAVCHVTASTHAQTVTYTARSAPLPEVFSAIEKQTGYVFFYRKEVLEGSRLVTVELRDVPLADAVRQILSGQPLEFEILGNTIVLSRLGSALAGGQPLDTTQRSIKVRGVVLTEAGVPVQGANVTIKKTEKGTITNAKGEFELSSVAVGGVLVFSYVGYAPQSFIVKDDGPVRIVMKVAQSELDKVVVQAYGNTTQRLTTSDIATVTSEQIEQRAEMNPLLALQGQVAGLEVTPTSGYASAPIKVDLRGINSINNGVTTDPLYIIDGVPLTTLDLNGPNVNGQAGGAFSPGLLQNGLGGPAAGQSPFFSINPADIESIEVLKDADATAIYGSRGANGVILITTKKGKAGRTQFDLGLSQGVTSVIRHWAMLTTPDYLQMRREALGNDGITPTPGNAPDLLVWDTTRNTDWQKYLWGHQGQWTDLETSLSGGDPRTTFRIGAGYNRETEITTKSGANQRANISVSLTHKLPNQRMTIQFSSMYSFAETNMIYLGGASTLPPDAPPVFDKNGNLNYAQWDALGTGSIAPPFPFANLLQPYESKTYFLNTNLSFNYSVTKNISAKVKLGYNNAETNQTYYTTIASQDPANNPTGTANFGNNRNDNWIVEPQVEYNGFAGAGKLNILIGGTLQKTSSEGMQVTGLGYTSDELIRTVSGAASESAIDNFGEYKYAALFGRLGYNWKDKYIVNFGARRDGSSRFASGSQYGNFGSIGIAWLATEEQWLLNLLPKAISFLKLRGSYGTAGLDAGLDYAYLSRWSNNSVLPYNGVSSLVPLQLQNTDYHWQVNHKTELGLDLSFFKNTIGLSADIYENRCNNQLIYFPTPEISGFTSVTANSPADVENWGYDLVLRATLINTSKFFWNISINGNINKNKLIAYPNFQLSPYTQLYKIGQPLNITWRLQKTGVDPLTGQYSFVDRNHDGQVNVDYAVAPGTADDDRFAYDLDPKFLGGLQFSFRLNNITLSFSFYGKSQIGQNALLGSGLPGSIQNQSQYVFQNRWETVGQVASVAKFTTQQSFNAFLFNSSDATYTDASFIRLSYLTLGYNLPASLNKQMRLTSANIFINSNNLFVITKYKGLDPETQNFGGLPPTRTIRFGLKCNF